MPTPSWIEWLWGRHAMRWLVMVDLVLSRTGWVAPVVCGILSADDDAFA